MSMVMDAAEESWGAEPPSSDEGPRVEGDVTVAFEYDLDHAHTALMRERIYEALSLRPARVVVDLSACPFIDAQGIGVLLDAHKRAWVEDRGFVLRGCNERVLKLLALAGLMRVFAFED